MTSFRSTRNQPILQFGASTRAAVMLQQAIKGWALVNQRDFATEDDLKFIAPYVLMHRLKFQGAARDANEAFKQVLQPTLEKLIRKAI